MFLAHLDMVFVLLQFVAVLVRSQRVCGGLATPNSLVWMSWKMNQRDTWRTILWWCMWHLMSFVTFKKWYVYVCIYNYKIRWRDRYRNTVFNRVIVIACSWYSKFTFLVVLLVGSASRINAKGFLVFSSENSNCFAFNLFLLRN